MRKIVVEMEHEQTNGSDEDQTGAVCCCARCGAGLKKPLVCSQCKAAAYCSKDCQIKDWKAGHKQACKGKMTTEKEGVGDCKRKRSGEGGVSAPEPRLYTACQNGDIELVEMLLGKGATLDMQNSDGWTALFYASQNGHGGVVEP